MASVLIQNNAKTRRVIMVGFHVIKHVLGRTDVFDFSGMPGCMAIRFKEKKSIN